MSPVPLGWSLPRGAVQGELLGRCLAWRELDLLLQTGLLGLALPTLGQGGTYPRGKSKAAILLSFLSFALRRGWSSKHVRKEPPDIPGAVAAGSGVLWWSWSGALSQREQEGKALCFPLACSVAVWLVAAWLCWCITIPCESSLLLWAGAGGTGQCPGTAQGD